MRPTYAGSMFIETRKFEAIRSQDGGRVRLVGGGVAEIGMMETGKGIVPGGVRDASTHRVPDVLPSAVQVRDALELAKWSVDHQQVFEGVVAK